MKAGAEQAHTTRHILRISLKAAHADAHTAEGEANKVQKIIEDGDHVPAVVHVGDTKTNHVVHLYEAEYDHHRQDDDLVSVSFDQEHSSYHHHAQDG